MTTVVLRTLILILVIVIQVSCMEAMSFDYFSVLYGARMQGPPMCRSQHTGRRPVLWSFSLGDITARVPARVPWWCRPVKKSTMGPLILDKFLLTGFSNPQQLGCGCRDASPYECFARFLPTQVPQGHACKVSYNGK